MFDRRAYWRLFSDSTNIGYGKSVDFQRPPKKETYWTGFKEFGKTIRLPWPNSYFKVDVVIWQEGHITIYPANYDSLSFKFSGCLMARFRIDNLYYIVHIHTSISENDCRKQWTSFLYQFRDRIEELLIFKPGCNGTIKKGLDCWGLITRTGECYTLEVKK